MNSNAADRFTWNAGGPGGAAIGAGSCLPVGKAGHFDRAELNPWWVGIWFSDLEGRSS